MKKVMFFIFIFFISINVSAKTITVKYSKCADGDTAHFIYNNEDIKVRFIGIDTPEIEHDDIEYEYYGNEAKEYTCKRLEEAKTIKLEYDDKAGEKDKYDRHLVYVWLDGSLLNEDLVYNGYAEAKYIYDNYKYKDRLEKAQEHAKNNKLGIWNNNSNIPSNSNKNSNNTSNSISNNDSNKTSNKKNKSNSNKNDSLDKYIFDEDGNINIISVIIIIIVLIISLLTNKKVRRNFINSLKK